MEWHLLIKRTNHSNENYHYMQQKKEDPFEIYFFRKKNRKCVKSFLMFFIQMTHSIRKKLKMNIAIVYGS